MNLKELYKKKIDEIPNSTFNSDQKRIAKDILEKCNDEDIQNVYNFCVQRVKLGFRFDSAPSYNNQSISLLKQNKELSLLDLNQSQKPFDENNLTNDNVLIIGENYDALKNLLITHRNKIDIIYIDPPYNTDASINEKNNLSENEVEERQSSKFIYRDKFSRTGWLNLMQDRLVLAKDLLTEDGVIFVSIDDSEQAYLKVLMDEIFGEENFVGNWPRLKSTQGKNDSNQPVSKHDYLLMYQKCKENKSIWNQKRTNFSYYIYDDNDGRGPYHLKNYISATEGLGYVKTLDFEIEINNKIYVPMSKGKRTRWLWNKERIEKAIKLNILVPRGELIYSKKYLNYQFNDNNELIENVSRTHFDSLNILDNFYSNKQGTKELENILGSKQFSFPKPISLCKFILNMIDKKNCIILDFFAGSGTTAQACLELNEEDGGNRRFILVTNNPEIMNDKKPTGKYIAKDITYERLYRILKGMGTKGEKDFKWIVDRKNPPYKSNNLKVFDIKYYDISIHDDLQPIIEQANESFRLLDNSFDIKDEESLLNKLRSLHPYKNDVEEEK